jgi:uncharacterized membrane protein YkvA (DUF1232 family)
MAKAGDSRRTPLLAAEDFAAYLKEKCMQLAPGDVKTLLAQARTVRARAAALGPERQRLQRQINFALTLVEDHAAGRCPQIPYYSVAALAVALLYFTDPVDVIPDWIPGVGTSDDAIIFELAFGMARAGVQRYCAWKSLPTDDLLSPAPKAPSPKASKRKPARRR